MVLTTPNVGEPAASRAMLLIILPGQRAEESYDSAGTRILDTHL